MHNVALDGMGDAASCVELVDGGDGCGLGARCRAKANLARIGKGERAVEEYGVHAWQIPRTVRFQPKCSAIFCSLVMPLHSEAMSVLGPTMCSIVLSAWSSPVVLTVRMTRSAGVASLARTDLSAQARR